MIATGFIIGQVGGPIYGYGATEEEALAVARKWASGLEEIRPFIHGRMVVGEMFIAPATPTLLELVKEVGGDIGYRVINGVACTKEDDEATL